MVEGLFFLSLCHTDRVKRVERISRKNGRIFMTWDTILAIARGVAKQTLLARLRNKIASLGMKKRAVKKAGGRTRPPDSVPLDHV